MVLISSQNKNMKNDYSNIFIKYKIELVDRHNRIYDSKSSKYDPLTLGWLYWMYILIVGDFAPVCFSGLNCPSYVFTFKASGCSNVDFLGLSSFITNYKVLVGTGYQPFSYSINSLAGNITDLLTSEGEKITYEQKTYNNIPIGYNIIISNTFVNNSRDEYKIKEVGIKLISSFYACNGSSIEKQTIENLGFYDSFDSYISLKKGYKLKVKFTISIFG